MDRSRLLISLLTFVLAPFAVAHDLWIEPSSFRPAVGERVDASLRVGEHLAGDPMPRIPTLVERFTLGNSPLVGRPGADPAGSAVVAAPGLQWIGYQSKPYPMAIEAAKFDAYLKEEGLERVIAARAKKGQSAAPGRERFYRCAKALLNVPGATGSADVPLGFTLELVPRKNPYALRVGDALPVTLTYRGKPIANVLVVAMSKHAPNKAVRARTDVRGRVSLPLHERGFWLVKAVHMEAAPADAGVDWESWWASLTFDLQ